MKLRKTEISLTNLLKDSTPDEQAECLHRLAKTFGFKVRTWQNAISPEEYRSRRNEYHRKRYAGLTYGLDEVPDPCGLADLEIGESVETKETDMHSFRQKLLMWARRNAPGRKFKTSPIMGPGGSPKDNDWLAGQTITRVS